MLAPQEIAKRCADIMWTGDAASRSTGMEMTEIDEGRATFDLNVTSQHVNGHGICHGGVIFMLADTTFAFACNSRNQSSLVQHCQISYVAPARLNDRLSAVAREVSLVGRNGIYDVHVTNQNNESIAEFRGFSRAIKGALFQEET